MYMTCVYMHMSILVEYMFQFQVLPVRGYPPQWYGLTMEGRAHTQCYVGNSFMSRLCFTTQCAERSIPQGGRVR